ncbi:MAG: hypothetical protein LBS63_00935 [Prevotellaceae bacterium]|nr:hypothetical protein [Prevotellaceae bacterium]
MIISSIEDGRVAANAAEYRRLRGDPCYTDVRFNPRTGGLVATHRDHNFDVKKGWYEKEVQRVGYEHGASVVFGKEGTEGSRARYAEGTWDGKLFEVAGKETATPSNIKKGLNHCAGKPDTKIAVLYFPNHNFDSKSFERGLAMYNGVERSGGRGFRWFEQIICIQGDEIVYKKSHR